MARQKRTDMVTDRPELSRHQFERGTGLQVGRVAPPSGPAGRGLMIQPLTSPVTLRELRLQKRGYR